MQHSTKASAQAVSTGESGPPTPSSNVYPEAMMALTLVSERQACLQSLKAVLVFTASWTICKDGRKRAPPGLHTCVAPRACGQRGHDAGCRMQAELGPELPTRSVQRRQGCRPQGLQPRCLPSHTVYQDLRLLQSVSTKKRNTLKIEEARLLNCNFL